MNAKKENATIVGVGVVACAVCCAGPILGYLAAIGLGGPVMEVTELVHLRWLIGTSQLQPGEPITNWSGS